MNSLFRRFKANRKGFDWVFPDQHGNLDRFHQALDFVNFNPKYDRVFIVGDIVNRGPHSEEMLDELHMPGRYSVIGNHEWSCVEYTAGAISAEKMLSHGGAWFISQPADIRKQIVRQILTMMPFAIEVETTNRTEHKKIGIVHAEVIDNDWQKTIDFLEQDGPITRNHTNICWTRDRVKEQQVRHVHGIDRLIVGHTRVETPQYLANTIAIETGGWRDGKYAKGPVSWMSMYNVHDDEVVQMHFQNEVTFRYGT